MAARGGWHPRGVMRGACGGSVPPRSGRRPDACLRAQGVGDDDPGGVVDQRLDPGPHPFPEIGLGGHHGHHVDGPLEDASGDGIPNLLLYALGLSIQSPDPAEVTRHRLRAGAAEIEGESGREVAFILPRPAPGDIRYIVEESCDGGPWIVIATKEGRGGWTGTAMVTDSNSMAGEVTYTVRGTSGATVCFYRVRFELIP